MLKCQVIMDVLERIAPKRLAEEWDNPGLLVGSPAQKVERVLVCLDVTEAIADRAAQEGCQLIISHHPVIFRGIKKVRTDQPIGRLLQKLLKNDIAVFAAHTNLDIARGGVNDVLAGRLGLKDIVPFDKVKKGEEESVDSLGRMGRLEKPVSAEEFAAAAAKALDAPFVRLAGNAGRRIEKVALCSGAGSEFIQKAAFLGADAYVTGDVRYHEAQSAAELGLALVDAGHFPTEFPVVEVLAARLGEELARQGKGGAVEILTDNRSEDFFTFVSAEGKKSRAGAKKD